MKEIQEKWLINSMNFVPKMNEYGQKDPNKEGKKMTSKDVETEKKMQR